MIFIYFFLPKKSRLFSLLSWCCEGLNPKEQPTKQAEKKGKQIMSHHGSSERRGKYATCCFVLTQNTPQHILDAPPEADRVSGVYAHVGHKRRALSPLLDVVIIRHGARRGGRGSLFAVRCPPSDWIRCVHCSFSLCERHMLQPLSPPPWLRQHCVRGEGGETL